MIWKHYKYLELFVTEDIKNYFGFKVLHFKILIVFQGRIFGALLM